MKMSASEFVIEKRQEGPTAVVTGRWSGAVADALRAGVADGLDLNYARGFRERDLTFLDGSFPVRRLDILARTLKDLSPVASLTATLEEFHFQTAPTASIDLGDLPHLKVLSGYWDQLRPSICFLPALRSVIVLGYDDRDLTPFGANRALEQLIFKDVPRIETLDGVEDLPALAELGVFGSRRLADITALARSQAPIQKVMLENCRAIPDVTPVADLRTLTFLGFSECGDIPSLAPLAGLDRLEVLYAYGTTRVVDGNLSILLELPRLREVRMQDRRHYRPRVRAVQQQIATRAVGSRARIVDG